jgi:hypothetical protein
MAVVIEVGTLMSVAEGVTAGVTSGVPVAATNRALPLSFCRAASPTVKLETCDVRQEGALALVRRLLADSGVAKHSRKGFDREN